jgi:receptor tyrosine kinase-like orphan receptor 1
MSIVQGDLHEFLMSHSPRTENPNEYSSGNLLEQNEMLFVSAQIAAGMVKVNYPEFV